MVVKKGYKQTDIGVIPEDWEETSLGQLSEFITSGSRGWAGYYSEHGALFVRSQNVRDGRVDFTDRQCVRPPAGSEVSRTRLKNNDLLVTVTGNSVGNVARISYDLGDAYVSQHVGLVRLIEPSVAEYVCRFLAPFAPGNPQIWASQTGQSKPGLKLKDLEEFVVVLPPTLAEQQAIAGALSDADAWIESLEQLIAKKRQIKQGAMQELLTGKRRLPGFSGKWETKRLEEIGSTYSGLTGKTKSDFGNGDAHYVTFMNVMSNVVIDCATFERVNVVASESQNLVRKNDILFNGSSETPEEVAMCAFVEADVSNVYLNSFCFGFRFHEDLSIHGRFLAYYLRSTVGREMMKSLAQGSTRYNLSKTALLKAVLALPSPAEQAAIATVLSDMDTEIESLESKLAKAREIKQGMMQELLTGKIRLIEN
jgi:type I restriction enzyme S subunit